MSTTSKKWVVRDDDAENGTTWVRDLHFDRVDCDPKIEPGFDRSLEATWTHLPEKAREFDSELEARLVAMQVGGRARALEPATLGDSRKTKSAHVEPSPLSDAGLFLARLKRGR